MFSRNTGNPPQRTAKERLQHFARRVLIGGPDPSSPQVSVAPPAFDLATQLLHAGPSYLEAAETAFRHPGYSVSRIREVSPLEVRA